MRVGMIRRAILRCDFLEFGGFHWSPEIGLRSE